MKRTSLILLLVVSLVLSIFASQNSVSAGSSNKVLLIARETSGSDNKQNMDTNEAVLMKSVLEESGFKVEIASASGRTFFRGDKILESDLKLVEVNIPDYVGFIIPCMEIGGTTFKPEEVAIAKQIVAEGKPVAAQRRGVDMLAQAGVLVGKRYSYENQVSWGTHFNGAIYSGKGVVQDGKIITSTYCAYRAYQDQTVELTKALIAELQK